MKTKIILSLSFLLALITFGFAQQETKKQRKETQKIESQKATALLIDSKTFVFVATRALPQGYKSVDLTTNPNFVQFEPAFIKSEMPYFGKATGSVAYGGGGGLDFEGIPEKYTFTKSDKAYAIKAVVRGEKDSYTISLTVFFTGNASMIISSNTRSSISYTGTISKLNKKK